MGLKRKKERTNDVMLFFSWLQTREQQMQRLFVPNEVHCIYWLLHTKENLGVHKTKVRE